MHLLAAGMACYVLNSAADEVKDRFTLVWLLPCITALHLLSHLMVSSSPLASSS